MKQKNSLIIPKIIGHRGVKNLSPENTLNSIEKAFELGLKWVEVDVKITKDNIPVLIHDDNLDRTTNGSGLVSSYKYSEIRKLDAGKFYYNKDTHIYVPTLEEVLNLCLKKNCGINIELKPNKGLEEENIIQIFKVTKKFKNKIPIYYSSFCLQSCIQVNEKYPNNSIGILIDDFQTFNLQQIFELSSKHNFFSLGLNYNLIKKDIIAKIKKKNLFISVFAEKNIEYNMALNLWKLGVDSIFSDDPRRILEEN